MIAGTLVLLLLTLGHSLHDAAPAPPLAVAGGLSRPCRLGLPKPLNPAVDELWRSSPTFRRQCVRISEARVIVGIAIAPVRVRRGRAMSRIVIDHGRVVYASVTLRDTHTASELLPHELEHVLEQIEGRDLARDVRNGRATWQASTDAYETDRAHKAGERARDEVAAARDPRAPRAVVATR